MDASRAAFVASLLGLAVLLAACDGNGSADDPPRTGELTVSAQDNIFAAGLGEVPSFDNGGGSLPEQIRVSGASFVTFSDVEGSVSANPSTYASHGPDGGSRDSTDILSYGGVSGLVHDSTFFFLVGVFLTNEEPAPPAPQRLNVTGAEGQVVAPAPEIGQTFYVGDGRTASGQTQRFAVPRGAERLFLGFADTSIEQGAPGYYYDDAGSVTLTFRLEDE